MASREYPRKRARVEATAKPRSFIHASEIVTALQADNVESLSEGTAVIELRNVPNSFDSSDFSAEPVNGQDSRRHRDPAGRPSQPGEGMDAKLAWR